MQYTFVLNLILLGLVLIGCTHMSKVPNEKKNPNEKKDISNSNHKHENIESSISRSNEEELHNEQLKKEKEKEGDPLESDEEYEEGEGEGEEEEDEEEEQEEAQGFIEKESLKERELLNQFYFMNDFNDERINEDSTEFEETLKTTKNMKEEGMVDGLHKHENNEHTLDNILADEIKKKKNAHIQMELPVRRKLKDESPKEHEQIEVDKVKNGPLDQASIEKRRNQKLNSVDHAENIRKENKKENKEDHLSKLKNEKGKHETHHAENKKPTTTVNEAIHKERKERNNNMNKMNNNSNNNNNINNDNGNNNINKNEKVNFENLHKNIKEPTTTSSTFENDENNKSAKIKIIKPEYIKELFDILHELFLIIRVGLHYRVNHFVIPLKNAVLSSFLTKVDLFFLTLQSLHKTGSSQYRDMYGILLLLLCILFVKYLLNKCFQTNKRKTKEVSVNKQGETIYMENLLKRILFNLEKKKKEGNVETVMNDILENTENILVNINIINKENKNIYTDMITNINNIGVYTYISTQALKKINTKTDTIINELTTNRIMDDNDFDPMKNDLLDRLDENDLTKMSHNLMNEYEESDINKMKFVDSPLNEISSSGLNEFLKKPEESEYEHPGLKDLSQPDMLLNKSNPFLKNTIGVLHKRNVTNMNNLNNLNNMNNMVNMNNNEFDYMNVVRNNQMNKPLEPSINNAVTEGLGVFKENTGYTDELNKPNNNPDIHMEANMDMNTNMNISRIKSGSSKKLSIKETNQRNSVKPPAFGINEYKESESMNMNMNTNNNFYEGGFPKIESDTLPSNVNTNVNVNRTVNNTNDHLSSANNINSNMMNTKEVYNYENELIMNQGMIGSASALNKKKSIHEKTMEDVNSNEDPKSSLGKSGLVPELSDEKLKEDTMLNKNAGHNYMNPQESSITGENVGMGYQMNTSSIMDSLKQSTPFSYIPPVSQISEGTTIRGQKYVTQRKERQKIVATKSPFS